MLTNNHIFQYIEPYLDNQLSAQQRQQVEDHLAVCPVCAHRLFEARRIRAELGPVMQATLGRPNPPPDLRSRVRQELYGEKQPALIWAWRETVSGLSTLAIIIGLVAGLFVMIQSQRSGPEQTGQISLGQPTAAASATVPSAVPTQTPPAPLAGHSLGETLPTPTPPRSPSPTPSPSLKRLAVASPPAARSRPPGGTIAFPVFDPAPHRQQYEIHLIRPDGSDHRIFELDGVSEPALRRGGQIAFRAWGEATTPRSLLSGNLAGAQPRRIGGFWEDAQPDWSPTEYRLIFATQRESDRHWRLYTVWGDGSAETNLRREGKSPTFAPDGYRFAFIGCNARGEQCGLWHGDLDHSEHESRLFWEDSLAQAPDWSPAGEQIVYMANPDGNWDLYLVRSDGTRHRRLTTDPAVDGLPAWSPDGQWLAFLSDRGGQWGVWLLPLSGGEARLLYDYGPNKTVSPADKPLYQGHTWQAEQLSWSR